MEFICSTDISGLGCTAHCSSSLLMYLGNVHKEETQYRMKILNRYLNHVIGGSAVDTFLYWATTISLNRATCMVRQHWLTLKNIWHYINTTGCDCRNLKTSQDSYMVKYNVLTFYRVPHTGKWLSASLFFSCISFLPMYEQRDRYCAHGRLSLLEKHLLWSARPMLDLRGLISLDNKTKRVNVLIVADGAGILGKCVKLVLTSRPHNSPPYCDL